jgi:gamma-glutamylputrescine oxidase
VIRFEPGTNGVVLQTADGRQVRADRLLLACNAYGGRLAPTLQRRFLAMYTNLIGTAPLSPAQVAQVLTRPVGVLEAEAATSVVYRLTPDQRLLFGAGGPFVGRDGKLVRKLLTQALHRHFPALHGVDVPHVWGGWFGMTSFSDTPDIGRLDTRVHYAQAIPVVWAIQHGRLLAAALSEPGSELARGYELLARIDVPPGPGGSLLSTAVRLVADAVAKVRALGA